MTRQHLVADVPDLEDAGGDQRLALLGGAGAWTGVGLRRAVDRGEPHTSHEDGAEDGVAGSGPEGGSAHAPATPPGREGYACVVI